MSSRRFIPKGELGFIILMPLRRGSFLDYRLSGTAANGAQSANDNLMQIKGGEGGDVRNGA